MSPKQCQLVYQKNVSIIIDIIHYCTIQYSPKSGSIISRHSVCVTPEWPCGWYSIPSEGSNTLLEGIFLLYHTNNVFLLIAHMNSYDIRHT